MKKLKQNKYIVLIYAAAIILAGVAVLLTSITVAQGAEENRVVAEQSEYIGLNPATATPAPTAPPVPATAQPAVTQTQTPVPATPKATKTESVNESAGPIVRTERTPGPEFITEQEALDAYPWVAEEIFGLTVDKDKLTAGFYRETAPHEWWIVYGPKTQCYIDAVSGEVLRFSAADEKYTGKLITLEEANTDQYGADIAEDPDNAYAKMATEIVTSRLADGRNIESVGNPGIQFVWDNDKDGFDPNARGTIAVDVAVLMETGRSYRFTFWGTEEIELIEFSSHPTQDACHWYYFYEDQAEEYSGHA